MGGYRGNKNNIRLNFELNIVKTIFRKFFKNLDSKIYKISTENTWITNNRQYYFDLTIQKNNNIIVLVEIQNNLSTKIDIEILDKLIKGLVVSNVPYGILTDNKNFYLLKKEYNVYQEIENYRIDFKDIIKIINDYDDDLSKITSSIDNIKIDEIIKKNIVEFIHNIEVPDELLRTNNFVINGKTISFKNLSLENTFFDVILGGLSNHKTICRYIPLESMFEMINNKTFRLNGIQGMNDIEEANFVFNTVLKHIGNDSVLTNQVKLLFGSWTNTAEINKKYISSFSIHKDDLTLYRLYADDARGACLFFKTNNSNDGNIILRQVAYEDKNKKYSLFFYNFFKEIYETYYLKFEFINPYWFQFIKSENYKSEREVRLLVIENNNLNNKSKNWMLTKPNFIINPYIEFDLIDNTLPVTLEKILLGPKSAEKEINKKQITEMLLFKEIYNIEVDISNINNYR